MKIKKFIILIVAFVFGIAPLSYSSSVYAKVNGTQTEDIFSQNDITFYDPDECKSTTTNVSVCGVQLPEATINRLTNDGVKEKAQANIERYQYAEEQTGVPWQAIAALHYREGGMRQEASISNGQNLTSDGSCYTNVDNIQICGDANKDAKEAAEHLISTGMSVYGVDVSKDTSTESLGKAFLTYNRGYMYKDAKPEAVWDTSPYVMNWFDDSHMHMHWQHADSWYGNTQYNDVEGYEDGNPGALAVFAFLCGGVSSSSSNATTSTPLSGNNVQWIGDSYSVGAYDIINKKLSGVDVGSGTIDTAESYIQVSKFVSNSSSSNPSCLDILDKLIKGNQLRQNVVVACGTNGGWSDSDISTFQDKISGLASKFVVVTSKTPNNDYAESNKRLEALASSNNRVFLADWTAVYSADYFASDPEKNHPTTAPGYEKWVNVIYEALLKSSGNSCTTYQGKYPEYAQCDPTWGDISYGSSGQTICRSGCGAASMAMLATVATGQDIFPNDIAKLLGDKYYYDTSVLINDPIVGEHYGFEVVKEFFGNISEAETKIRDYLQRGYMIHMTGHGCHPGFQQGSNCSDGHLIGIFDIDSNDNVTLANSAFDGNQVYKLHDVVQGISFDVFIAIKGDGNRNTCSGLCKANGTGGLATGGFSSADDADAKIMAPYREMGHKNSSSDFNKYHIVGQWDNCVSFVHYFVTRYLNIKDWGWISGDGGAIAGNFYSQYSGSNPNLQKSNTPSAYSVGSCGATQYVEGAGSHTFIVLGVNSAKNTMIVGEAGYNNGIDWSRAREYGINEFESIYNTPGACTYVNVNDYLKGDL